MTDKKQFAIDHMNKDHLLAIYDFVNAFAGQKLDYFKQSENHLKLVDVDFGNLYLEWKANGSKKTAKIPIEPPMTSYSDLRSTTVQLANKAAKRLDVSPYQVKTYKHWDNLIDFIADLTCWFIYIVALTQIKLVPYNDNAIFRFLDDHSGKVAIALILAHSAEVILKLMPKLKKYRVPSPAYEKWCFSTAVSGLFTIKRFERQAAKLGHE